VRQNTPTHSHTTHNTSETNTQQAFPRKTQHPHTHLLATKQVFRLLATKRTRINNTLIQLSGVFFTYRYFNNRTNQAQRVTLCSFSKTTATSIHHTQPICYLRTCGSSSELRISRARK